MYKTIMEPDVVLTRGAKILIEAALIETKSTNRRVLLSHICDSLTERYSGTNLDYQAGRMHFQTTGEILKAIDTYMYQQIKNGVVKVKDTQELRQRSVRQTAAQRKRKAAQEAMEAMQASENCSISAEI
jgi:hypothetical protein